MATRSVACEPRKVRKRFSDKASSKPDFAETVFHSCSGRGPALRTLSDFQSRRPEGHGAWAQQTVGEPAWKTR